MLISEDKWIEISKSFIEAYSSFYKEGKETSWLKLNNRDIEISFLPRDNTDSNCIKIMLYCPEIERILETNFNLATHNTEEIIKKLYWIAKNPQFLDITKITTSDFEEEYKQLRETVVGAYKRYFDPVSDTWEKVGTEIRIIELHGKVFKVIFEPDGDERINVNIDCVNINSSCSRIISKEEQNPRDIIMLIQNLAWNDA